MSMVLDYQLTVYKFQV